MKVTALLELLVFRLVWSSLRGMLPALLVLVAAVVLTGSPDKGFIIVAGMAALFAYAALPMSVSTGQRDGTLAMIRRLPVSRGTVFLACCLAAAFMSSLFTIVVVGAGIPALASLGVTLGPGVGPVIAYAIAVTSVTVSIAMIPLYARFQPMVAAALPIYLLLAFYLAGKRFPIGEWIGSFVAGVGSTPTHDWRVLGLAVSIWAIIATSARVMAHVIGLSFGVPADPKIDVDELLARVRAGTTNER
jgi:hypothetical protein